MNTLRVWPKGIPGTQKRMRFVIKKFILSPIMDNLIILAVVLNTFVMALDRYGLKEEQSQQLSDFNTFFTWFFIVEFILKMIALGP